MGRGLADDIGENRTQGGGGGGGRAGARPSRGGGGGRSKLRPSRGEAPVAQRLRSPRSGNAQDARCPSAARPMAASGVAVARERDNYGISSTLS